MDAASAERLHPLDHLVLPTASLDTARARLTTLGFIVAPNGVHPFGTENCCVYFSDGTFMEPLAIGDPELTASAAANGNVFVKRDQTYRKMVGQDGFSAVVFGTGDADADHARYHEAGLSAGDRLDFSRPFMDAAGRSDTASFRLAFAAAPQMHDAFVFACERVNAPNVDRSALQAHANGVTAIAEVVAVSDEPAAFRRFLAIAAGAGTDAPAQNGELILPNAKLTVLDSAVFTARFGIFTGAVSSLRFMAVVFSLPKLENLGALLAAKGIEHDIGASRIVVPPSTGQGAAFIFEDVA